MDNINRGTLKLYRTPHSKHWTVKVVDHPIFRQLTKEAGLKGKIYITDAEYDAVLAAAGNHGISLQTTWPEEEESMTKSKQLIKILADNDGSDFDEYDDSDEPQSDDIVIDDESGKVLASGKVICSSPEWEEMEQAIVDYINREKWYPAIWHISDHGNVSHYTLDKKYQKKIKV